jgi:type I restriction enzyme S subunit
LNNDIGEVPDLPAGWAWASVVDFKGISGLLTDGDWILSKEFLTGDEVRLIQLGDIGEGYFLDKTSKRISCKRAKELNCTFLADGDVLISRMAHPLARACQLPSLQYKCITAVDVSILRPDEDYFDGKYIKWLFNARGVRQQAEALSSGTTRKRISRKNLEIVSVPIPPLNEQHRIVAKVEELFTNLDAGVEALKKVQAQVKRYRQAVLKNAFEGKLTAEWREAHKDELEPASVLLERIREDD